MSRLYPVVVRDQHNGRTVFFLDASGRTDPPAARFRSQVAHKHLRLEPPGFPGGGFRIPGETHLVAAISQKAPGGLVGVGLASNNENASSLYVAGLPGLKSFHLSLVPVTSPHPHRVQYMSCKNGANTNPGPLDPILHKRTELFLGPYQNRAIPTFRQGDWPGIPQVPLKLRFPFQGRLAAEDISGEGYGLQVNPHTGMIVRIEGD